jgi:hypothetical protein
VLPCCTVNVLAVIELGSIAVLKVAAIFTLRATPEPSFEGLVELTVSPGPLVNAVAPRSYAGMPPARRIRQTYVGQRHSDPVREFSRTG